MNAGKTARWATRLIALAMVVVAMLAFRVMKKQLERIHLAAERVESRAGSRVERSAAERPPQPPTAALDPKRQAAEAEPEAEVDPKRGSPSVDPSEAAREEALPQAGRLPEGAIW